MKVLQVILIVAVDWTLASAENEEQNLIWIAEPLAAPPLVDSTVLKSEGSDERLVAVVNTYFDAIVDKLRQFVLDNGLDPMPLPDIHESFRVGLLLLAITGDLKMTNGLLRDFSTLRRDGDVIVEYRKKQLDVHFVIGFEDLIMAYDYKAKLLHIGPKGGIIGKIKDMTMEIDMSYNTETSEASLTDLQITHTGSLDLKFTGTIIVDLVLNTLSDVITLLFKSVIVNVIEQNVRDAINDALSRDLVIDDNEVFTYLSTEQMTRLIHDEADQQAFMG